MYRELCGYLREHPGVRRAGGYVRNTLAIASFGLSAYFMHVDAPQVMRMRQMEKKLSELESICFSGCTQEQRGAIETWRSSLEKQRSDPKYIAQEVRYGLSQDLAGITLLSGLGILAIGEKIARDSRK